MNLSIKNGLVVSSILFWGLIAIFSAFPPGHGVAASPNALPDLVVTLSIQPQQPQPGQEMTVTMRVTNQGSAYARDFDVCYYLDPPTSPPDAQTSPDKCFGYHMRLNPGVSTTFEETLVVDEDGVAEVWAWVDRTNAVQESNEDNNLDYVILAERSACPADAFEPDDSCATATLLPPDGAAYRHTFCGAGDQDWVRIDAVAGVEYVVRVDNVGEGADSRLDLYDACDQNPLQSGEDTLGRGARLQWVADVTGPYYLQIRNNQTQNLTDTHYEIALQVQCQQDAYEPDNTCQQAREIQPGQSQDRGFCLPGDEDWLRFEAVAGQEYHFRFESIGPAAQPQFTLFPACNNQAIASANPGQPLDWSPARSGVYYLRITDASPQTNGPNAHYRLRFTISGDETDGQEPNDAPDRAHILPTDGVPRRFTLSPQGDQDWFYFQAQAGVTYRLETLDLSEQADTVLCLYEGGDSFRLLACDDDSGEGKGSRVLWRAPASRRYYFKVRDYRPEVGGAGVSYAVAVTANAQACDPDAYEPDDHFYQAQEIPTDGSLQTHNVCPSGDADWLRFWTPAGRTWVIETTNLGPDADTLITLYDRDARTPLWRNDDAGSGLASRILWTFSQAGFYYLKIEPFTGHDAGRGTTYGVRISPSSVTPTPSAPVSPTPTFTPTPTPTPTPAPSPAPRPVAHARTLILTNRARWTGLYGETEAQRVMDALIRLAGDEHVQGVVVDVDQDPVARAAYTLWAAHPTDIALANQVADAIHAIVMRQAASASDLKYIVLAGDDRIIPYRRVPDQPEITHASQGSYTDVSPTTGVGAAILADQSLNDDFYAASAPIIKQGRPLYLPEYAIGRLVETPDDVIAFIDAFLQNPTLEVHRALVSSGWSNFEEGARDICQTWRQRAVGTGGGDIDCTLIGEHWRASDLRSRQLQASPPYDLQALALLNRHYTETAPDGIRIYAQDILQAPADLSGAVIWNTGAYAGLNVPPENPVAPLDLPEAFQRRGATYIGNTGLIFAGDSGVMLSERLMRSFAMELAGQEPTTVGEAWMRAKRHYYETAPEFSEYDRKTLSIATLYGLPMYRVDALATGTFADPFDDVDAGFDHSGAFGDVISDTLRLDLRQGVASFDRIETDGGDYYALGGYAALAPQRPAQPQYFTDIQNLGPQTWQGLVWTGGVYEARRDDFPWRPRALAPGIPTPVPVLPDENEESLWPPHPAIVTDGIFNLALGQYDADNETQRLFTSMTFDVYFATDSLDEEPPQVTYVAGRWEAGQAHIKVAAHDASGVQRVAVTYTTGDGWFRSVDLNYHPEMDKWVGDIPFSGVIHWLVSAVDGAGNVTTLDNKGQYYRLTSFDFYLPMLWK